MMHEGAAQLFMATQCLVQKHSAPASNSEDLFYALSDEPVGNLVCNAHGLQAAIQDEFLQPGVLRIRATDMVYR